MAFKVFTNGSTLQASEVNDNLMRQAVSTFSNAAARTAAITAPSEGMLTYLEDVDRYEWWTGSSWRSPFGLTQVAALSFTTASSVTLDNVFTTAYDNYRIIATYLKNTTGAPFWQLRAGGTTITATNYGNQVLRVHGGSVDTTGTTNTDNGVYPHLNQIDATRQSLTIEIQNAALASPTTYQSITTGRSGLTAPIFTNTFGQENVSSARDGIILNAQAGTLTGNIKVYGYRN